MAGRMPLAGLVAGARERYVDEEDIAEWFWEQWEWAPEASLVEWLADEAVRLAEAGVYFRPWNKRLALLERCPAAVFGSYLDLGEPCPGWGTFTEVFELAAWVDSFLATLERGGPGKGLARGCREDLDGLPVLADWCEENGLPAAAAEARHLHRLVRQAVS
jgi:hypothetical protein